jgi:hypothetical protein
MKSISQAASSNNASGDSKSAKNQTFDHAIFRLVSFMASFVSLPFKSVLSVTSYYLLYYVLDCQLTHFCIILLLCEIVGWGHSRVFESNGETISVIRV